MTRIGIRLPQPEKDALAAEAKQYDTTISQLVRKLIRAHLQKENEQNEC